LFERAARGEPLDAAWRTRLGLGTALLGASTGAVYVVVFASFGLWDGAVALALCALNSLAAIALFASRQRYAGHLSVTFGGAAALLYFHGAMGPSSHALDLGYGLCLYPPLVFDRRQRVGLWGGMSLWVAVLCAPLWLDLEPLRLTFDDASTPARLAPHSLTLAFLIAGGLLWFFNRERASAATRAERELHAARRVREAWAVVHESTASAVAERGRAQQELLTVVRRAGLAQVADRALHLMNRSVNRFTASMAAMRNDLGALCGRLDELAESLRRGAAPDLVRAAEYLARLEDAWGSAREDLLREVDVIAQTADHVAERVGRQQGLSRLRSTVERVALATLIQRAVDLASHGERPVAVDVEDVEVTCDTALIIEVVAVLVTNALEATLDGRCGRVHVFASATDDRLRVVVEDGGEGFEPGTPLFEPGVTTRGAQRGFGLHSAANLVVGLGGQITLDSGGPGHGATATVDVPLGGRVSCAA